MRRVATLFVVFAGLMAVVAFAAPPLHLTTEICIQASDAGALPRDPLATSLEAQNNGTTNLYCALVNSTDAQVVHSRAVAPNATWTVPIAPSTAVWCIAQTSDQRPDAGPYDAGCTIVTNFR